MSLPACFRPQRNKEFHIYQFYFSSLAPVSTGLCISTHQRLQTRTFAYSSEFYLILSLDIFQTPGLQIAPPTSGQLSQLFHLTAVLSRLHRASEHLPSRQSQSEYQCERFRALRPHSTHRIISSTKTDFTFLFQCLSFSLRNVSHGSKPRIHRRSRRYCGCQGLNPD